MAKPTQDRTQNLYRLRSVLADMIQRLEDVSKLQNVTADPYGGIEERFDAAAHLACELGYPAPPIQYHRYCRDGENDMWPTIDGKPHDPADEPSEWFFFQSGKSWLRLVGGYRLNNLPDSTKYPRWDDLFLHAELEGEKAPANRIRELWEGIPPEEHREHIKSALRSWLQHTETQLLVSGRAQLTLVAQTVSGPEPTSTANGCELTTHTQMAAEVSNKGQQPAAQNSEPLPAPKREHHAILHVLADLDQRMSRKRIIENIKSEYGDEASKMSLSSGTVSTRLQELAECGYIESHGHEWAIRDAGRQRIKKN